MENRYHILFDMWLDAWLYENLFDLESPRVPAPGLSKIPLDEAHRLRASQPVNVPEHVIGLPNGCVVKIENRPEGRRRTALHMLADIVPEDQSIDLAGTWHHLEQHDGENFRWATGTAEFRLDALYDGTVPIAIDLEPGPGMGGQPMALVVEDADGLEIAETQINARDLLLVPVPVHAGPYNAIRLRARNGGLAIPTDARVLDFRIFRIERAAMPGSS